MMLTFMISPTIDYINVMIPHNLHYQTHAINAVLYNHDPVFLSQPVTMDNVIRRGHICLLDQLSNTVRTREEMMENILTSSKNINQPPYSF